MQPNNQSLHKTQSVVHHSKNKHAIQEHNMSSIRRQMLQYRVMQTTSLRRYCLITIYYSISSYLDNFYKKTT